MRHFELNQFYSCLHVHDYAYMIFPHRNDSRKRMFSNAFVHGMDYTFPLTTQQFNDSAVLLLQFHEILITHVDAEKSS